MALRDQSTSMAENGLALHVGNRRRIAVLERIALAGKEALDAGENEADTPFAVGEDESPCGQPAAAPALDGLTGDA